jgi:hypothetical protein
MSGFAIQERPDGLAFKIKVQPRSSRNATAGVQAGVLKLKLTAPPVENAANRLCVEYLAERLQTAKSAVEILTGLTGRLKLVLVRCSPAERSGMIARIERLAAQ